MITQEKATEIAHGWSELGFPGANPALYRFASWGGRIFDEEHRAACCEVIYNHLCWLLSERQNIADRQDKGDTCNTLDDWANLVRLEQFIRHVEARP